MELKPNRTKKDYQAALKTVDTLWTAKDGTDDADRLEVLTILIEHYERENFPIPDPAAADFLQHIIEARGNSDQVDRRRREPGPGALPIR